MRIGGTQPPETPTPQHSCLLTSASSDTTKSSRSYTTISSPLSSTELCGTNWEQYTCIHRVLAQTTKLP